jgi:HlyD family secretion protein
MALLFEKESRGPDGQDCNHRGGTQRNMKILKNITTTDKRVMPGLFLLLAVVLVLGVLWWSLGGYHREAKNKIAIGSLKVSGDVRPALSVTIVVPNIADWPQTLSGNGSIAAWHEASIGSELGGVQLVEVRADVGDTVRSGQVLAVFSSLIIKADMVQAQAAVTEAEAVLAEAKANAERARKAQGPGVISAQQINEYFAAEKTAAARLEAARAQLLNQQTRLQQTMVTAPDKGVISSRSATLGSVPSAGQELFRLIRADRLEWRAEVASDQLHFISPGQHVSITAPGNIKTHGLVRMLSPNVDPQTRMGLVYVDISAPSGLKAGMFAQGAFELGRMKALTLPQSAVVQRDGFAYVYCLELGNTVKQTKVLLGRRQGQSVEIISDLAPGSRVVATGAAFLVDGDTVRVVDASGDQPGGR